MKRHRRRALVAEINITPFTDVILVVLVIFMITTPLLSQSSLNVELPQASTAGPPGAPASLNVTITKDGSIYLEGRPTNKNELKEKARAVQREASKVTILLNIDQGSEFKNVVGVLDVLRGLGIRDFSIAATTAKP